MGYVYLASPYSHPDAEVRRIRYAEVCRFVARDCRRGTFLFSPILYSYDLAFRTRLPTDADFWRPFNHTMLTGAERLLVLKLPGWEESQGVRSEIQLARKMGKPVEYAEP